MAEKKAEIKYEWIARTIVKFRNVKDIDKCIRYAQEICKGLCFSDELIKSIRPIKPIEPDMHIIVKLDAILIGIFKKYYEKHERQDKDLYLARMLNGYGLLDGYYHHDFISDAGDFGDFYPTSDRAFDFLSECNISEQYETIRDYCGDSTLIEKILRHILPDNTTENALNKIYATCIHDNTKDGRPKLPHYPDLWDSEKSVILPSYSTRRQSEPKTLPTAKKVISKNVPLSVPFNVDMRPSFFTGREELLATIRDVFVSSGGIQILYGQAGFGKTAVAKEYAFRYRKDYQVVWWINADSYSNTAKSCRQFLTDNHVISEGRLQNSNEHILSQFREYFYNTTFSWLLIYDNADYLDNSDDNGSKREALISSMPEATTKGHILITSRCNANFMEAKRHQLSVLTEEQALEYLQKQTKQVADDDARVIAEKLGYLPLALCYVVAYITEQNISYGDYLELWNEYGPKVLDEEVDGVIDYHDTVRAAFMITVGKLKSATPGSKKERISIAVLQFLNICAYTAPDDISLIPYIEGTIHLPEELRSVLKDKMMSNTFERELVRYSLFDRTDKLTYSIHRLLQEIIRDEHTNDKNNPTEAEKIEIRKWINCSRSVFNLQRTIVEYGGRTPERESLSRALSPHAWTVLRWYARYVNNDEEGNKQLAFEYSRWINNPTFEEMQDMIMREKEVASLSDLLDFLHSVPYGEQTYLAPLYHDLIAQRYRNMGKTELATQHFNKAIELATTIFEKNLYSPIKSHDDCEALCMTISAYHDAIMQFFLMEDVFVLRDLSCYADTILQLTEKITIEAAKLDWSKEYPGHLVNNVWGRLTLAYEIKFKAKYILKDPKKEDVKALGEEMLKKEGRDSIRQIIINIVNYIIEHYSEMDVTEERGIQWVRDLTEGWQQILDPAVQSIERQMLTVGDHNH